jgi:hypothetical protein
MGKIFKNLEQLGDDHDILIFDACAVRGYLSGNGGGNTRRIGVDNPDFISTLRDHISSGRNYIIPGDIIHELASFQREQNSKYGEISELLEAAANKNKRIEDMLMEKYAIDLSGKIDHRVDEHLRKSRRGISRADIDLVKYAEVLREIGTKPAIISNDSGPLNLCKTYRKNHDVPFSELGTYIRRGLDSFEQVEN